MDILLRNAVVSVVLLARAAFFLSLVKADCYFNPVTGEQFCSPSQIGWQPNAGSGTTRLAEPRMDASAHCRITVGDGSTGSGTLIARDRTSALVLTCSHLFDQTSDRIVVTFPDGARFAARLVARDRAHDLAALAIRRPKTQPAAISQIEPSGVLSACGFGPTGQFRCIQGSVVGQATAAGASYPSLTIQGSVRPGDSGGGVLNSRGQLTGVVWGQRDGLTYATCGRPVREFLKRALNQIAPVNPSAEADSPNSARVADDSARGPQVDWQAWSGEIEQRLRALDAKKQDKGEYLRPGDLNGYLRAGDAPHVDESQFARKSEVSGRFEALSASFKAVHARVESVEDHVTKVASGKVGFFQGLSLGKLVVGALGLSGPLAAAVVVAGGLAGRRVKKRLGVERMVEFSGAGDAPHRRPQPIAVDSPPLPQRTVPETHYVPFEKDSYSKAHQWASEQVVRKYPGATEVLQAQDSLIKQFLNAQ